MISLGHILIVILVLLVLFGPTKIPAVGQSLGEGVRNLKKSLRGEEDIDVTHTVKKLDE